MKKEIYEQLNNVQLEIHTDSKRADIIHYELNNLPNEDIINNLKILWCIGLYVLSDEKNKTHIVLYRNDVTHPVSVKLIYNNEAPIIKGVK